MRVIRVFPRRTKATPVDQAVRIGDPQLLDFVEGADRVEISVTFTWDKSEAERLAQQWRRIAPTIVDGPAYGNPGREFVPGKWLRPGYVITSRGCPCRCRHCFVPEREGKIRELPITDGWLLQDNNLLACSLDHQRKVFAMLARQAQRIEFTGGLEARRVREWHVDQIAALTPRPVVWLAYDDARTYEAIVEAARKFSRAGWHAGSHRLRAYVLVGFPGDTLADAEQRLRSMVDIAITPMAMLFRGAGAEHPDEEWARLQRRWARPAIIHARER